ncbi:MAG: hypothetical protein IJ213_08575 [Bacteroidales bacterium]|nr:hypothetical protein [Bacteroidales bacterium]
MQQTNYTKIFAIVAWVALMAVSCWATAESLRLLLPSIPYVFIWVITIIFFVIASIGSKLIVDSLNSNIMLENRTGKLWGGIVIMLIFWVIFSLPTNTHTFFYRSAVRDVVTKDLSRTKEDLKSLGSKEYVARMMFTAWDSKEKRINSYLTNLTQEAQNPAMEGIGPRFETILKKIEVELGTKIQRVKPRTNNHKGWNEVVDNYTNYVNSTMEQQKLTDAQKFVNVLDNETKKEVNANIRNITTMQRKVANMDKLDTKVIESSSKVLSQSYALIDRYNQFLGKPDNKSIYQSKVSKTDRMLSVIDVWKDYFKGEYKGRGFIFWLILSMLVDIAGFIMFDIAFRKKGI